MLLLARAETRPIIVENELSFFLILWFYFVAQFLLLHRVLHYGPRDLK
jgi:hypothetical protein